MPTETRESQSGCNTQPIVLVSDVMYISLIVGLVICLVTLIVVILGE